MEHCGKTWKFGDDINTDLIIPARYLNTSDPEELALHCMEDEDADFIKKISPGDIIVAGKHFGCGSSREHAPICIKAAGIACVIAKSYARIFFRNSFNIGLPIFEVEEVDRIQQGDELQIKSDEGLIINITRNEEYSTEPFPPFMQELIQCGGLMEMVKRQLDKK
ncbi:MAG: 3-isopropylmalate dehydratase small subunit [Candidatus Theseobacter exili]|nr:3-isopropylmalate dehydratase small subunit [Candidatus Theseobacter exili]